MGVLDMGVVGMGVVGMEAVVVEQAIGIGRQWVGRWTNLNVGLTISIVTTLLGRKIVRVHWSCTWWWGARTSTRRWMEGEGNVGEV